MIPGMWGVVWKHPHVTLAWCRGWGTWRQGEDAPGICHMCIQLWTQPGRVVPEESPPCPSGRRPALQGPLGTPGWDQQAALPVPKSRLSKWARAWWHTRGESAGWVRNVFINRCLQSKFHSILTSGLFLEPWSAPPTLHPQLPCPLGFCLFVTL